MADDSWITATALLRIATQLVDGIQDGLAERGFDDVRPAHGFAFARLSESPATTGELAGHLGITKQAASQLVGYLVTRGYLTRDADPCDARARLLALTERGHACTAAAERAAADTVDRWKDQLTPQRFTELEAALRQIATPSRLRPVW